jgi:hypothetical protein
LQYIYHRLFFLMAISLWHFPEPLNLTTSLVQSLQSIDKVQKMID